MKKVKLETSLAIPCENFGLYTDKLSQVLKLEQELKIKSSDQRFGNISSEDLKTASYIFIYINLCPGKIKPWIIFFQDLFQTQPLDQIILTLNRVVRITSNNFQSEFFKNLSGTLLEKVKNSVSLKDTQHLKVFDY